MEGQPNRVWIVWTGGWVELGESGTLSSIFIYDKLRALNKLLQIEFQYSVLLFVLLGSNVNGPSNIHLEPTRIQATIVYTNMFT